MKKGIFVIIAIILSILICMVNINAIIHASNWINAGAAVILILGIVMLLHGLLMLILIIAAIKLPLRYMLAIWGFFIALSFLPLAKSHLDDMAKQKREMAERATQKLIDNGTATIDDFVFLYGDDDEEIFINALSSGYRQIAEKTLAAVCDSASGRLSTQDFYLAYKEKYGHKVAIKKVLGWWLVEAVENRLPAGVELLLAAGADVNAMTGKVGNSPLMVAAKGGQLDIIRLFMQQGADINAANESGESALMAAVERGQLEAVRLLLQLGADVNAMDSSGQDALYRAVTYGYISNRVEIAKLLIESGADVERRYRRFEANPYKPLLFFAQDNEDSVMVEFLTHVYQRKNTK